ncbi:MAG: hypothetical protein ACQERX_06255 [Bacillota bacterium]
MILILKLIICKIMNFETTEEKNKYFDMVIDEYLNNNFDFVKNLIINLERKEQRDLLYFVYSNKDKMVNPGLYSFMLDVIFMP